MIQLSESQFQVIPAGIQVFNIIGIEYKANLGTMKVTMATKDGLKHTETFRFKTKEGKTNQGGINVFSYFARTAFNNFSLQEINEEELVGHYIKVLVEHDVQPNKNDPSKTVTFIRLKEFSPALGFDGADELDEL